MVTDHIFFTSKPEWQFVVMLIRDEAGVFKIANSIKGYNIFLDESIFFIRIADF